MVIFDPVNLYTTGTRLLNTCPPVESCGALRPYWSDDIPPTAVGATATITAYMSLVPHDSCKYDPVNWNRTLQVMRCSLRTPHDLI